MKKILYAVLAAIFIAIAYFACIVEERLSAVESLVAKFYERSWSASGAIQPIRYGRQFAYGRFDLIEVESMYAKAGERWLPVYTVVEVTTNMPPCRRIDRTGAWYAPSGGCDAEKMRQKMRDEYVPPRPYWEDER